MRASAGVGGLPPGYWISTKVDGKDGDYSARRVRRSIEESVERLGLDHFPLVYLHDPEYALDQGLDAPAAPSRSSSSCGTKASSTTSVSPAVTCT